MAFRLAIHQDPFAADFSIGVKVLVEAIADLSGQHTHFNTHQYHYYSFKKEMMI